MNTIWAFLLGLGVGTGVALLLAPQAGRKTQKLVSQEAQKGLDQVAATGQQAVNQIKEWAEKSKDDLLETVT